ncbi:hypothetical protein PGQ11_010819 [Apiospora arundinis]|uniref:Uncharacterized protein n=1 Tax=Apiospora arundinis TaxID=335852 RepID=A0ABR2ID30_9PEZI
MAKIPPLAAKTLHNVLANHAVALEKKAPKANPPSVPLPKQTEDEIDELTFTYVDFNDTEGGWSSNSSSSSSNGGDDASDSTASTPRSSFGDEGWDTDGGSCNTSFEWSDWAMTPAINTSKESVADMWFGSDTTEEPISSVTITDRGGSDWGWDSRGNRKAEMETYKKYRVQRWTPRQLELFRFQNVFSGRDDERDHDRLLAARYMKERALDFVNRRKSQAKSRFNEHSDRLAKALEEPEVAPTNPTGPSDQPTNNRWVSMTVDEF